VKTINLRNKPGMVSTLVLPGVDGRKRGQKKIAKPVQWEKTRSIGVPGPLARSWKNDGRNDAGEQLIDAAFPADFITCCFSAALSSSQYISKTRMRQPNNT
jgi:hypothetical protein